MTRREGETSCRPPERGAGASTGGATGAAGATAEAGAAPRGRVASGGLAHEVNNALQPLVGLVGAIGARVRPEDPELAHQFEMLEQHALYAREIVADLLVYAAREATAADRMDALALMRDLDAFLRGIVPEEVGLQSHGLDPSAPGLPGHTRLQVSRVGMQQVMQAIALTLLGVPGQAGPLRLSPAAVPATTPDTVPAAVAITLATTSTMPAGASTADLFNPFLPDKPAGARTGVGLAMAHGLVAQWDGTLRLAMTDAQPRVTVTLPTA